MRQGALRAVKEEGIVEWYSQLIYYRQDLPKNTAQKRKEYHDVKRQL